MTKKYRTLTLENMTDSQEMIIGIVLHEGELRERERIADILYSLQGEYLEDPKSAEVNPVDVLQKAIDSIDLDYEVEKESDNG
jgi:hypothetical protein